LTAAVIPDAVVSKPANSRRKINFFFFEYDGGDYSPPLVYYSHGDFGSQFVTTNQVGRKTGGKRRLQGAITNLR
jgi:hypothetical protein